MINEKESQSNSHIDIINRKFRTLTGEIDDIRGHLGSEAILLKRIEDVETKAHDLWILMEKAYSKGFMNGKDDAEVTSAEYK